jgi:hypothetical protein
LAVVSNVNFDIIAPGISLKVYFTDTSKKPLELTAQLVITTLVAIDAGTSSITLQAESAVISTNHPDLDDILNSAVVPYLRTKINTVGCIHCHGASVFSNSKI